MILIVCFFEKGIKAVLNYKKSLQQCVVNPISEDVKEGLSNQRDDVSRQKFFLNIAILSSLMGILVQNIFDYNLYIPVNAILFWILLALSCSFQNTVKRWEFSLDNTSRWWCKIVVMVVLLNLIIVVGRPFLASRYYVVGETFIENKNFNEAEKAFKKSIKLDHFWPYAYFGLAKTYVGNNKEGNAANKIKYAEAVVEIKKAINYDKYNAFFYYNLAYFYEMIGDNKKAEESINKAILYHYYKAEYHKFLADIYKNQGMNEKAEYEFALSEKLINKYP